MSTQTEPLSESSPATLAADSLPPPSPESPPSQPTSDPSQTRAKSKGPSFGRSKSNLKSNAAQDSSPESSNAAPSGQSDPKSSRIFSKPKTKPRIVGQVEATLSAKDKKKMKVMLSGAIQGVSKAGASTLVRDPIARDHQLFIAKPAQADDIADPIVSILGRHGTGAGVGDSDAGDYLTLGIAIVFGYMIPNLELRDEIRQLRASQYIQQTDESDQQNSVRVTQSEPTTPPVAGDSLLAATSFTNDGALPPTY